MKRRYSSSSSDDDLPLQVKESHNVITKRELCEKSQERCDMCDKVFYNKYNLMLHNTKHMIIPLFHHPIYQCSECVCAYTTSEELRRHMLNKHLTITNKTDYIPEVLESFIKNEPLAIINNDNFTVQETELDKKAKQLLENFVNKQPITVLTKEPLFEEPLFEEESTDGILNDFVRTESVALSPLVIDINDDSCDHSTGSTRVRDRILFEDEESEIDDEEDIISIPTAITTDFTYCNNNINNVSNVKRVENLKEDKQSSSVHYDELMIPGVFKCKKCSKSFPHRFTLIMHEAVHVKFRKKRNYLCRKCDWYVGDLTTLLRHQRQKHPDLGPLPSTGGHVCAQCGLRYYKLNRHRANYHPVIRCRAINCGKEFNDREEYTAHLQEHSVLNTQEQQIMSEIKVCEMCCKFLKNTARNLYIQLRDVQEPGVRQRCQRCSKPFFELKLIRLTHNRPMKTHLKKTATNEDRLKNLQNRLKKLKLLNKF